MQAKRGCLALLLIMSASPVWAHVGWTASLGFAEGLWHPWSGADHLLAMSALGFWAGRKKGRGRWLLPSLFLTGMVLGASLQALGVFSAAIAELWIALSLVMFAGVLVFWKNIDLRLAGTLALLLAMGHGMAHAAEMPANAQALFYGAGFLLGSVLLHMTGFMLGRGQHRYVRGLEVSLALGCAVLGAVGVAS
ncbi:MAG: HupE/UreJ family protein [Methylococcales bacterium]|nr:HupE/UreJ family protein [Methylococcales bacterium]